VEHLENQRVGVEREEASTCRAWRHRVSTLGCRRSALSHDSRRGGTHARATRTGPKADGRMPIAECRFGAGGVRYLGGDLYGFQSGACRQTNYTFRGGVRPRLSAPTCKLDAIRRWEQVQREGKPHY